MAETKWGQVDWSTFPNLLTPGQKFQEKKHGHSFSAFFFHSVGDMVDYKWNKVADVAVYHTGSISWVLSGEFIVTCPLDLTYFPMDSQVCSISWSLLQSDSRSIKLKPLEHCISDFRNHLIGRNGVWHIDEISSNETSVPLDWDATVTYSTINFTIKMHRKPWYFVLFGVCPICILSLLGLMQFLVPPADGEKLTFGITVMLSCFVYLTNIESNLPENSDSISLLGMETSKWQKHFLDF